MLLTPGAGHASVMAEAGLRAQLILAKYETLDHTDHFKAAIFNLWLPGGQVCHYPTRYDISFGKGLLRSVKGGQAALSCLLRKVAKMRC